MPLKTKTQQNNWFCVSLFFRKVQEKVVDILKTDLKDYIWYKYEWKYFLSILKLLSTKILLTCSGSLVFNHTINKCFGDIFLMTRHNITVVE